MNLDWRLLRLIGLGRWEFTASVACGLAAGILAVLQAGLISRVVAAAFLQAGTLQNTGVWLAQLLAVLLLRSALGWGMDASGKGLSRKVKTALRSRLIAHLVTLGPGWSQRLEQAHRADKSGKTSLPSSGEAHAVQAATGGVANVIVEGVDRLEAYYSEYLPQLLLAVLVPAMVLVFVFPADLLSGFVLLVTAPLIPLFLALIGSAAQAETKRQWAALNRMSAFFLDILQGMTTLKLLGRSQVKNVTRLGERYRVTTLRVLRVSFLSALALELAATLCTAVVAVEVGLRLLYGQIDFELAFFVLLLAPEFYQPLRQLGARFHAGMAGAAASESIFHVLDSPAPSAGYQAGTSQTQNLPAIPPNGSGSAQIRFERVSFEYEQGPGALHEVSFTLQPGVVNLLVGPSGSGKSTLALLLIKGLQPTSGTIWVGEQRLDLIDEGDWLARTAWVSQKPILFDASVADNIRLGRPQASQHDVEEAARLAQADGFIRSLPQGYDTPVGERGLRLSAGQAQRIALARAFLRQPALLILDEASSGLDAVQDAGLQHTIWELARGRTTLIIAHRLSAVEQAGQILYLEDGRLLGAGTDQSLSADCLPYRRLRAAFFLPAAVRAARPVEPAPLEALPPEGVHPASEALKEHRLPYSRWQVFRWLLSLLAPFSGWVGLSALLGFATVGSGIGLMATSAYLLSAAALQPSIAALQVSIVGVRAFGLLRGVFRYLERLVSHDTTFRLLARLRLQVYRGLEQQSAGSLVMQRSGDIYNRMLDDLHALESFFARGLAPFLSALLTGVLMVAFLALFQPSLALGSGVSYLLAGAALPLVSFGMGRNRDPDQRLKLSSRLVEGLQGLAELRAYQAEVRWRAELEGASAALAAWQQRQELGKSLSAALVQAAAWLAMWSVLVAAVQAVSAGHIKGVALAAIVLAAVSAFEALHPLPQAAQAVQEQLRAGARLLEIVHAPAENTGTHHEDQLPASLDLHVEGLSFAYPLFDAGENIPADRIWALNGLSFHLPQGRRLALVGPSGSGKSTLLHLLLRFWDYEHGEIRLGGSDIRCIPVDMLRRLAALAPQRADLFNTSLRENLLIARPDASDQQLYAALSRVQLRAWVDRLPQGLDTWIGEQGARLSAGERQRLVLARLFLLDAPLLLLDEPLSALDAVTGRQVWQALDELGRGRSVVLATHQLNGMESMDLILVLQKGRIVEQGTHTGLLARGGYYRQLWDAWQAGAPS